MIQSALRSNTGIVDVIVIVFIRYWYTDILGIRIFRCSSCIRLCV